MHLYVESDDTFTINTVNSTPNLCNLDITIIITTRSGMLLPEKKKKKSYFLKKDIYVEVLFINGMR